MWESLREAVDEEMERDPTVCVMGAQHCLPPLLHGSFGLARKRTLLVIV